MSPSPMLLAVHVTIALALTILVGVQSVELGRLRGPVAEIVPGSTLVWAVAAVPVLAFFVGMTGGMLLNHGSKGGPWIAAGVVSVIAIAATAVWILTVLRRKQRPVTGVLSAGVASVQWGVPAVTLAAAFLMADRPQSVPGAAIPIVVAAVVAAAAFVVARRVAQPSAG